MLERIRVQVKFDCRERTVEILARLEAAGMTITDRIDEIGTYSGVADRSAIPALEAVPGVIIRSRGAADRPEAAEYAGNEEYHGTNTKERSEYGK